MIEGEVVIAQTQRATSSLAFAGNDPRYGPRRGRHAHGRYYGLLHTGASLDDNLICRDWLVLYDLLRAIRHWAQPPEGAQIVCQATLYHRCQRRCGYMNRQILHSTYRLFLISFLEAQRHLGSIRVRQPDAERDEVQVRSASPWRSTTLTTFKTDLPHVPCKYIARLCISRSHGQDLHIPARWKGSSHDSRASSPMQSIQVPDGDKRAALVDTVDNEPVATRAELPLTTRGST